MKFRVNRSVILFSILFFPYMAYAQVTQELDFLVPNTEASIFQAQTSFSGLLRTPTAGVVEKGGVLLSLANENNVDSSFVYHDGPHNTALLSLGILENIELSVQNTYKDFKGSAGVFGSAGSDLSFSIKAALPISFEALPIRFALGANDVGTHEPATHHKSYYGVSTWDTKKWDLSIGYGKGSDNNQMGSDYLNGVFGGVRWHIHNNFSALVDYDGTGTNWGMQWSLPESWMPTNWRLQGSWQIASDSSTEGRDNPWWSLSISKSLMGEKTRAYRRLVKQARVENNPKETLINSNNRLQSVPVVHQSSRLSEYDILSTTQKKSSQYHFSESINTSSFDGELIINQLKELGYENLRFGYLNQEPVFTFENNLYLQNELKALGEVIGVISSHYSAPFTLILQNRRMPVLAIATSGEKVMKASSSGEYFPHWLCVQSPIQMRSIWRKTDWEKGVKTRSSFGLPRLSIVPVQNSSLGTDWGVLDYTVGLSSNMTMDLWKGAVIDIRHLNELYSSDDVGFPNHPVSPIRNGVDRILLHQSFALPLGLMTQFSAGQVYYDYRALINETRWESPNGRHRVGLLSAYLKHDDTQSTSLRDNAASQDSMLLSYRYRWPNQQIDTEIVAGKFRFGDQGVALRSHHWFDDTKVTLEVKRNETYTFAGMTFELPLVFSRSTKPKGMQFLGINAWRWGYQTQLSGELNYLVSNQFEIPWLQHNLDSVYFDRDRLSRQYILENQHILLEGIRRINNTAGF